MGKNYPSPELLITTFQRYVGAQHCAPTAYLVFQTTHILYFVSMRKSYM